MKPIFAYFTLIARRYSNKLFNIYWLTNHKPLATSHTHTLTSHTAMNTCWLKQVRMNYWAKPEPVDVASSETTHLTPSLYV